MGPSCTEQMSGFRQFWSAVSTQFRLRFPGRNIRRLYRRISALRNPPPLLTIIVNIIVIVIRNTKYKSVEQLINLGE